MANTLGLVAAPWDDAISLLATGNSQSSGTMNAPLLTDSGATITVDLSGANSGKGGYPAANGAISPDDEIIYYSSYSVSAGVGTFSGCLRGQDGTTQVTHSAGTAVNGYFVRAHRQLLRDALLQVEGSLRGQSGGSLWYNVLASAYGADPTGTVDSTTAFATAVSATPVGGVLRIPAGTYLGRLNVNKAITVQGDGWLSTTIKCPATGSGPVVNVVIPAGVSAVSVTNGGTGYTSGSAVVGTVSGGGGTGATVTANIVGGVIQSVAVTAAGSGYTSAPTVSFPTGTGATFAVALVQATGIQIYDFSIDANSQVVPLMNAAWLSVAKIRRLYFSGGTYGIDAAGLGSCWLEDLLFSDQTTNCFHLNGTWSGENYYLGFNMAANTATMAAGFQIDRTDPADYGGHYLHRCRVIRGSGHITNGFLFTSTAQTTFFGVFGNDIVADNIDQGEALKVVNGSDVKITTGWLSAPGGYCVLLDGASEIGLAQIRMNPGVGFGGVKFLSTLRNTFNVTLSQNACHYGTFLNLPASNKPTGIRLASNDLYGAASLTNDNIGLAQAMLVADWSLGKTFLLSSTGGAIESLGLYDADTGGSKYFRLDASKNLQLLDSTFGNTIFTASDSQKFGIATDPYAGAMVRGVRSVTVLAGGTGYTNGAALTFTGGGGSGAAGTINVTGGAITSVTMTAVGTGYTSAPTVTAPTGTGANLVAVISDGAFLEFLSIPYYGTGSSIGSMIFHQGLYKPYVSGSVGNIASLIHLEPGNGATTTGAGAVYGIDILTDGDGIDTAAGIGIENRGRADGLWIGVSGKKDATATAAVTGTAPSQSISAVTVSEQGGGYATPPTITQTPAGNATLTATLGVKYVPVTATGSGYTSAPTVVFSGGGVAPTQATATALVYQGVVYAIVMLTTGSGYTSAPTVSLSGGGGTGATLGTPEMLVASVTIAGTNNNYSGAPTLTFGGPPNNAPTGLAVDLNRIPYGTSQASQTLIGYGVQIHDWSTTNIGTGGNAPTGLFGLKHNNFNTDHDLVRLQGNRRLLHLLYDTTRTEAPGYAAGQPLVLIENQTGFIFSISPGVASTDGPWLTFNANGQLGWNQISGNQVLVYSQGTALMQRGGTAGVLWLNNANTVYNATLNDTGNFGLRTGLTASYGLHSLGGAARIAQLGAPAQPTVTPTGTTGATTYTYYIVAKDAQGNRSLASVVRTVTTGNATLSASNFNAIAWTAVTAAASYDVVRSAGGASQGSIALSTTATSLNDTGLAASAYTAPSRDATGDLTVDGLLQTSSGMALPQTVGGTLYAPAAASTAITGITETAFSTSYQLPANSLRVGQIVRLTAYGIYTSTSATPTLTLKVRFNNGATNIVLLTSPAKAIGAITNGFWSVWAEFTVRALGAGTSATVVGNGEVDVTTAVSPAAAALSDVWISTPVGFDSTITQNVQITATWSSATGSPSTTLQQLVLESLN